MREFCRKLALLFFAGAVGALVSSLAMWLLGAAGVTAQWGVAIAPALTAHWLQRRIMEGALWALLLIPFYNDPPNRLVGLSAALSLLPTCYVLLVVWSSPTQYGQLAPLFVLAFNLVWGLVTGGMVIALRDRS